MICTYCGVDAQARDHVIPVLYAGKAGTRGAFTNFDTVPTCHECNSLLGSKMFPTFEARAGYIVKRLRERAKKLLAEPSWTADEIAELGPTLRSAIQPRAVAQAEARRRMAFAERQRNNGHGRGL